MISHSLRYRTGAIVITMALSGVLLSAGCDMHSAEGKLAPSPSPNRPGVPDTATDAANWWKHTLAAARTTPLRAELTTTTFASDGKITRTERFMVEEGKVIAGTAPRYCLTRLPSETNGKRIIVSDGETAWDYDAGANVVWQRQAVSLQTPPQMQAGVAGASSLATATRPELESASGKIAGRTVQVLALFSKQAGRVVERRWIDQETKRTLKMEEYGETNARLLRRWEVTHVVFGGVDDAKLYPEFPAGVRLVDSETTTTKPSPAAADEARRVHLPLQAHGFALRSVIRAEALKSAEKAANKGKHTALSLPKNAAHLLYRSGDQAISVFVSPHLGGKKQGKKKPIVLQPGPDWKIAALKGGHSGYTQETDEGTAVVWTEPKDGDQYIAVSRMPLSNLLPVIDALAANRETDSLPKVSVPVSSVEK